jgi:hypothetical protein
MKTLPAFKITLADGSFYVTSMAAGVTLADAKAYFLGKSIVMADEKTKLKIVSVEKA